jgi:hypothetical protein
LAIAWPADWWLECLPALERRLEESARLVRADGRLSVYALWAP